MIETKKTIIRTPVPSDIPGWAEMFYEIYKDDEEFTISSVQAALPVAKSYCNGHE